MMWKSPSIFSFILAGSISFLAFYFVIHPLTQSRSLPQATPTIAPETNTPPTSMLVRAAIPYWDQKRAYASFQADPKSFDILSVFWFYTNRDGTIDSYEGANIDQSIIDFAHEHGVKVSAIITNLPDYADAEWDSPRIEYILTHEQVKKAHIQEIVALARTYNFDGITIDYEELVTDQRKNFSQFIDELATALHKNNLYLEVSLHPKSGETDRKEDNGSRSQDWVSLSRSADYLDIMAYGEHWQNSGPGPIASLPWVQKIVDYTKTLGVPREKFFLGVPLYGDVWKEQSTERARGVIFPDIEALKKTYNIKEQWHDVFKTPFFRYKENGATYVAWYDNARSVREKAIVARTAGFAGVTFWHIGGADPTVWQGLKAL